MFCHVQECRYYKSHVTNGHKCGTCNKYGHGQLECKHPDKIKILYEKTQNDEFKLNIDACTSTGCKYAKYHKSIGHYCEDCKLFHIKQLCPLSIKQLCTIRCPFCKVMSIITTVNESLLHVHTDAQCGICYDADVNISLPCKCTKMCNNCFDKIKKT